MAIRGHLWTVLPRLQPKAVPPPAQAWRLERHDPDRPSSWITGLWTEVPDAEAAVLLVHGIGGCSESKYALRAGAEVVRSGLSCLRINLRGADRATNDFYHAGLTSDLTAALASPELQDYSKIYLLGFSLGGHLALRLAAEGSDPRVRAVVAVCSPLDLEASSRHIDRPTSWPYRRFVLRNLRQIYRAVAQRGPVPLPLEEAAQIRRLSTWDDRITAPHWGFADAADYYRQARVVPLLPTLEVPALLVAAQTDPMVPPSVLAPTLESVDAPALEVRWVPRGGHVGFPGDLDLGFEGLPGLEAQAISWLQRH